MSRELKRVPLDFDWPLNQVWTGYVNPHYSSFTKCPICHGEGYSPEAHAVAETFYPHQVEGRRDLAWHDKLGQAEVDMLVENGRLAVWDGATRQWTHPPRLAAEVNAEAQGPGFGPHDAINRGLLIRFRCARLGIEEWCPSCHGHGDVASDEERAQAEAWEKTEPPTGAGYQVWETVSEGSPISPVFEAESQVIDWLVGQRYSRAAAAEFVRLRWVPSGISAEGVFYPDVESAAMIAPER